MLLLFRRKMCLFVCQRAYTKAANWTIISQTPCRDDLFHLFFPNALKSVSTHLLIRGSGGSRVSREAPTFCPSTSFRLLGGTRDVDQGLNCSPGHQGAWPVLSINPRLVDSRLQILNWIWSWNLLAVELPCKASIAKWNEYHVNSWPELSNPEKHTH